MASTSKVKVSLNNENRILNAPKNYEVFVDKLKDLFGSKLSPTVKLYYKDTDGDLIIVSSQQDYELSFEQQSGKPRFYLAESAETIMPSCVVPSVVPDAPLPAPSKLASLASTVVTESRYIESPEVAKKEISGPPAPAPAAAPEKPVDAPMPAPEVYACLECDGRKTNRKGRPCRICRGTGRVPEMFLESVRNTISAELRSAIDSECVLAASKLIDSQQPVPARVAASEMPKPSAPVYRLEAPKRNSSPPLAVSEKEPWKQEFTVAPGEVFERALPMRNTGLGPWPMDTQLRLAGGDAVEATIAPVGAVEPGVKVDIVARIKAPMVPGRYVPYFRLAHGSNESFGNKPWIDFTVTDGKA